MSDFSWDKGFDCNFILKKIREARSVSGEKCSFNSHEYSNWVPILKSAINFRINDDYLKGMCIEKSIRYIGENLNNKDNFLRTCDKFYSECKLKNIECYFLFYTTYSGINVINNIKHNEMCLSWGDSIPKKFIKRAKHDLFRVSNLLRQNNIIYEESKITPIMIKVSGCDVDHCYQRAVNFFDLFRGILNLIVNSGLVINPFPASLSKNHAINRFRPGPFATVHGADGALLREAIWYELNWRHDKGTIRFTESQSQIKRNINRHWKKLVENKLSSVIQESLLRYCRSLDNYNSMDMILGLWSALEAATGSQKEKGDLTASRALGFFPEQYKDEYRQIISHIKKHRNLSAHSYAALPSDDMYNIIVQAEHVVGGAIGFLISNGNKFQSHKEVIEFCEIDVLKTPILRKRALLRFFEAFQAKNREVQK
ncbi:hypothetical protein [Oceanibaculum indicum]|uniref:Apea-like HEPN domain-containing protein n=1 Tax=Oceanibaculum indicum TaxID=526216 RepID=A0A420WQQ7_9PROT|nr:hypothetical protein [Oceanibaculum indicum]RKQ73329.1 hypothetical protein BCL74_1115 [Oceanibaculum indicum]